MWLSGPTPPCEQMPAVVGGGCWAAVTSPVVSYHPSPSVVILPRTPRTVARGAGTGDVSFAAVLPWLWLVDLPVSMVIVIGCKRVVGRSSSWGLRGRAGTSPSFVVIRPLRGGAISSTHPPCKQVLAAVEGSCGRGGSLSGRIVSRCCSCIPPFYFGGGRWR